MKVFWKQGCKGEVCASVREPSSFKLRASRGADDKRSFRILTNLHISLNGLIPCPEMHQKLEMHVY